jgi:hypothetical protein
MNNLEAINSFFQKIIYFHSSGHCLVEGDIMVMGYKSGESFVSIYNTKEAVEAVGFVEIAKKNAQQFNNLNSNPDFVCVVEVSRILSLESRKEMEVVRDMILSGDIDPKEIKGERVLHFTGMNKMGESFSAIVSYDGNFSLSHLIMMDVTQKKVNDIYDEEQIAHEHGFSSGKFRPSVIFSEIKDIKKQKEFVIKHLTYTGGVKMNQESDFVLYSTLINTNTKEFERISSDVIRAITQEMSSRVN